MLSTLAERHPTFRLCLIGAIGFYLFLAVAYVSSLNFFTFTEPGLVSISWLFSQGADLYPPVDGAAQYGEIYGPIPFVLMGLLLRLFGPSIAVAKLAPALFAVFSLAFLYDTLRRGHGSRTGLLAAGTLALQYFLHWPFSTFIVRPDGFILGFVALGLWACNLRSASWGGFLLGLFAGLAANSKITACLYFISFLFLLLEQHGLRGVLFACIGSAVGLVAPFLLSPSIDFDAYVDHLMRATAHGIRPDNLLHRSEQIILLLVLPSLAGLILVRRWRVAFRSFRWHWASFAASAVLTLVASGHSGSTSVFLTPLAIPLVYLVLRMLQEEAAPSELNRGLRFASRWRTVVAMGLMTLLMLNMIPSAIRAYRLVVVEQSGNAAINDIRSIMSENPGRTIAMGYGTTRNNFWTWYRPVLSFAGHPYLIDEAVMTEIMAAQDDVPAATLNAIQGCIVDIWLIPKGDKPFTLWNSVNQRPLFSEKFQSMFLRHFAWKQQSKIYDLWVCTNP